MPAWLGLSFALVLWLAAAAAADPVHYIVVERRADGSLAPRSSTTVATSGQLASLSATQLAQVQAGRDADVVTIRVDDANRRGVYQTIVEVPRWRRAELPRTMPVAEGESNIERHDVPADRATFVVRVPVVAGGRLTLDVRGQGSPVTFDLSHVAALGGSVPTGIVQRLAGQRHGDPRNRVDLLLIGDGYTAAQQAQFEADAELVAERFFALSPYAEYRNMVNVSTLFVASAQSGADQPRFQSNCSENQRSQSCCGDNDARSQLPAQVGTAFDATFCSYNIQRLLTVDEGKVFSAAAAAPEWDKILVIVNSQVFGGSGGYIPVLSMDSEAVPVAQHEYGHSFARLADEYENAYPGFPPCSDVLPDAARCEPNVTDETSRDLIKWRRWISPSTPIPSIGFPPIATDAGLWEGARYLVDGMYRQAFDGAMRTLGNPFGDVASEAYVQRLYEGGWGVPIYGIDGIEPGSEIPAPGDTYTLFDRFSAVVLGPQAGPSLTANWYVNETLRSSATLQSGDLTSHVVDGAIGDRVTLEVIDNSPIIHPTSRTALASTRTWTFIDVRPGDANCDAKLTVADLPAMVALLPSGQPGSCGADANGDAVVDERDIRSVMAKLFLSEGTHPPGPFPSL